MKKYGVWKKLSLLFLVAVMSILCEMVVLAAEQTVFLQGVQDYSKAADVLTLVNQERAKEGLSALVTNPELQASAMQRASELAVYYSHTRPDDTDCYGAITINYTTAGENIAYGYTTAETVMNAWMNSPGHRANILEADYTSMGVGCFIQGKYVFWVQMFTNNTVQGTVPTGQETVVSWVDVNSSNMYLYAAREDEGFCYGSPITIKEGETANVAIYNLNKGITNDTVPIEIMAYSFSHRTNNPYSSYFTYDIGNIGQYIPVTGVKSNENTGEAMPIQFGVGFNIWTTNISVRHIHTPGPEATCTTDQICTDCQQVLVKATGHKQSHYIACEKDITCTKCNIVLEKATGHKIQEPTCTEDGYCTVCRQEFGSKLYHTYPPRDCQKPLYCSRCGYQRYQAYESHYWENRTTFYQAATVFSPTLYKQECVICDQYQLIEQGNKLMAVLELNLSSIKLKKKQSFNELKVTKMSSGDSVVSVKSNKKKVVEVVGFTAEGNISLKAKKTGTAKIKIITKAGAKKTVTVKVQKNAVKTTKITNVKKSLTLKVGKTKALEPVLTPIYSSQKITYKSTNKKVVSVNASGILTAKKKGTATITVKSGSKSVKCKVKVK